MISTAFRNNQPDVHSFVELQDSGEPVDGVPQDIVERPDLKADFAISLVQDGNYHAGSKHHVFGFCYKGKRISRAQLASTGHILETYGVESDGNQYVCIVMMRNHGYRLSSAAKVPYIYGFLPSTTSLETISGLSHHVSVYKPNMPTNDPILAILKRPSPTKWIWCYENGNT